MITAAMETRSNCFSCTEGATGWEDVGVREGPKGKEIFGWFVKDVCQVEKGFPGTGDFKKEL